MEAQSYMKKSVKKSGNNLADFDLPDWSAMKENTYNLPPETAFQLSEKYSEDFPLEMRNRQRELRSPCPVEFVL